MSGDGRQAAGPDHAVPVGGAVPQSGGAGSDPSAPESVHLAMWPEVRRALIDQQLMDEMRLAQRLVSLGHAARNSANLKVRQPLAEAVFVVRQRRSRCRAQHLAGTIAEELNVKAVTCRGLGLGYGDLQPESAAESVWRRLMKGDFPKVQKMLREGIAGRCRRWAKMLLAGQTSDGGCRRQDLRDHAGAVRSASGQRRKVTPSPKSMAMWRRWQLS